MTKHDRTTERNHGTVGCPGVAPGANIVGWRQHHANPVATIAGDPLPLPLGTSRSRAGAR
jgi:hypothetical protein